MGFVLSCWFWCLMAPFVMSLSVTSGASAARGISGENHNLMESSDSGNKFNDNYVVTWGSSHVASLNRGSEVQLAMDRSSGTHH